MRILYHHRSLADGAEGTHITQMVNAFGQLGHSVELHGLACGSSAHPDSRARRLSAVRGLLPPTLAEATAIACNPLEYVNVHRAIRRFRPDLLYKRHARYDVAALSAARALGVPTVLEVNCLYSSERYRQFEPLVFTRVARSLEKRALSLADVVVTVSTPLATEAASMTSRHIVVAPNGANPAVFDPGKADGDRIRAAYGLGGAFVVGWAGILREWHGVEVLLDAVAALPGARLLIVGDGPARPQMEAGLAGLGLTDRTVMAGRVPHPEMRDMIAAMDVAVVADDRTCVASPMKLLEYMAMARAVVAPRLDNMRDLVEEEIDGLLFTPGDREDLRRVLGRLAANDELRKALGQNARLKVEQARNWRSIAERVLTAVAEHRAPAPGTQPQRCIEESTCLKRP